jgi:hypothetical protein
LKNKNNLRMIKRKIRINKRNKFKNLRKKVFISRKLPLQMLPINPQILMNNNYNNNN